MNLPRQLVIESPPRSGVTVSVTSPDTLHFFVFCDDSFYTFPKSKPVPLGRFLSVLGLTAEDCAQAIAEWQARDPRQQEG